MVEKVGCRRSAANTTAQAVGASGAPEPASAAGSDDFGLKTVFSPVAAGRLTSSRRCQSGSASRRLRPPARSPRGRSPPAWQTTDRPA